MAKYPSQELQAQENARLYQNGGALVEILSAGESAPHESARKEMQKILARSHAEICMTHAREGEYSPRLVCDLIERGLLTYDELTEQRILNDQNELTNLQRTHHERAIDILNDCQGGDFEMFAELETLLVYQVRPGDFKTDYMVRFTNEDVAQVRHQVKVRQAQDLLTQWRKSGKDFDRLQLFQKMIQDVITPEELGITPAEEKTIRT